MKKELWALIAGLAAVGTIKKSMGSRADRKSKLDDLGFFGNEAAGIMIVCPEDNSVLLGYRSDGTLYHEGKGKVREPGTAGIFGGKRDWDDENPFITAVRETLEETCAEDEDLFPQGEFIGEPFVYVNEDKTFKYTTFFYAIPLSEKKKWEPILNWENHYVTWYPLENVRNDRIDIPVHFGVMEIMENNYDALSSAMENHNQRRIG